MFENATLSLVSTVLDRLSQNHSLIASNMANVNTKGYKAAQIDFEAMLAPVSEVVNSENGGATELTKALARLDRQEIPVFESETAGVLIDQEMINLAENTLKYKALVSARSELSSIKSIAIKGRS